MSYTRFNWILLTALAVATASLLMISLFQEPLDGDLTRTGGFSEKDYGWQGGREVFEAPMLFRYAESLTELDQPYDVVILGDSFTRRAHISWASHLADLTGWKIIAFHHRDIKVSALLNSPQFKQFPPALFVYQTVERNAVRRLATLGNLTGSGEDPAQRRDLSLPTLAPLNAPTIVERRRTEYRDFEERIAVGLHYAKLHTKQIYPGKPARVSLPLAAGSDSLFTSREQGRILISDLDIANRNPRPKQLALAQTGLKRMHSEFSRSGVNVLTFIFPDKLSVYAAWLRDPQWINSSVIPSLAQQVPMPRLDLAFSAAAREGMRDIYAPNNTHTSNAGARLAAEQALSFLIGEYSASVAF